MAPEMENFIDRASISNQRANARYRIWKRESEIVNTSWMPMDQNNWVHRWKEQTRGGNSAEMNNRIELGICLKE